MNRSLPNGAVLETLEYAVQRLIPFAAAARDQRMFVEGAQAVLASLAQHGVISRADAEDMRVLVARKVCESRCGCGGARDNCQLTRVLAEPLPLEVLPDRDVLVRAEDVGLALGRWLNPDGVLEYVTWRECEENDGSRTFRPRRRHVTYSEVRKDYDRRLERLRSVHARRRKGPAPAEADAVSGDGSVATRRWLVLVDNVEDEGEDALLLPSVIAETPEDAVAAAEHRYHVRNNMPRARVLAAWDAEWMSGLAATMLEETPMFVAVRQPDGQVVSVDAPEGLSCTVDDPDPGLPVVD